MIPLEGGIAFLFLHGSILGPSKESYGYGKKITLVDLRYSDKLRNYENKMPLKTFS